MNYAIEVNNIKKGFKVHLEKSNLLKDAIVLRNRNHVEKRKVLQDINFKIQQGEAVGIIGRNGCGKSTTLKLLTRILSPDEGTVKINGRVSSLIELGAGFHPDMSGRENIYINASIFGIRKKEVDKRLNDIIRFSELEDYIDNPVRTYSSGMYMRLAFAVAINVDADILLIDEILAVGDAAFQEKCFERLKQLKQEGTTIVIVSHSLGQIEEICDRAIWIHEGIVKEDGRPNDVCRHYTDFMDESRIMRAKVEYEQRRAQNLEISDAELAQQARNASCYDIASQCNPRVARLGDGELRFTKICLLDESEHLSTNFVQGKPFLLEITLNRTLNQNEILNIEIFKEGSVLCWGGEFNNNKDRFKIKFENNELMSGKYWFDVRLFNSHKEKQDEIYHIIEFIVLGKKTNVNDDYGIITMSYKSIK